MEKKRIVSRPGLFGYIYHYDEKGRCIGKSRPSLMGDGKVHYNVRGKQVGTSRSGFIAEEVYHDKEKQRYVSSYKNLTGDAYFYNGKPVGVSYPGFGGMAFTVFDVENKADEQNEMDELNLDDEVLFEEDDLQEHPKYDCNNQKTIIKNIIVFVFCCLVVGILILIFK